MSELEPLLGPPLCLFGRGFGAWAGAPGPVSVADDGPVWSVFQPPYETEGVATGLAGSLCHNYPSQKNQVQRRITMSNRARAPSTHPAASSGERYILGPPVGFDGLPEDLVPFIGELLRLF